MTVGELYEKIGAERVTGLADAEISSWYAGDLLSHVMGKIPGGACWFTIMNNVNVAAVAVLADAACVVLCDGTRPDDALLARAKAQGVAIGVTGLSVYEAIKGSLA